MKYSVYGKDLSLSYRTSAWIFLMLLELFVDFTHEIKCSVSETSHFPPLVEGTCFLILVTWQKKPTFLLIENKLKHVEILAFEEISFVSFLGHYRTLF